MSAVKLELFPMPPLHETENHIWFKLRLNQHKEWEPDDWRLPATEEQIQIVLRDHELTSYDLRVQRLCELSGRRRVDCGQAIRSGKWRASDNQYVSTLNGEFDTQIHRPVETSSDPFWFYRSRLIKVSGHEPTEELRIRIKHKVLSHERALDKITRQVEAFENFEKLDGRPRLPIPQQVQMFVWQRDGGRCVRCGCVELLEFDHIIPVAAARLRAVASLMKHPACCAEEEWRLITHDVRGERVNRDRLVELPTGCRTVAGRIVPYQDLVFDHLPATGIVLGFSSAMASDDPGLSELLNNIGITLPITRSAVPVRP